MKQQKVDKARLDLAIDENKCRCGGELKRSHVGAELLHLNCETCNLVYLTPYHEMSDDEWDWVKRYYRGEFDGEKE